MTDLRHITDTEANVRIGLKSPQNMAKYFIKINFFPSKNPRTYLSNRKLATVASLLKLWLL